MGRRFTGWPEQAFEVLLDLEGIPSAETREKYRALRENLVRKPMIALLTDAADADPALEDFSVWGFAKDPWWWQHQCGAIRFVRHVEIGLRFDLDGLHVKGWWQYPNPAQVARYRTAVAAADSGQELVTILDALRGKGYDITGETMKRMPQGFSPDHDRAGLLRNRSVVAQKTMADEDWTRSPKALEWLLDTAEDLKAMLIWLARHVAEPAV